MLDVLAELTPRRPRPEVRLSIWGAVGATLLAWLAFAAASLVRGTPPAGYGVVLFTLAASLAAAAAGLVWVRAGAEDDARLRWVGGGLIVSSVAMGLQLVSFPAIAPGGGPLHTSGTGSSMLYLLFHWSLVAGAAMGLSRVSARFCPPAAVLGCLLAVVTALDVVPLPQLLRADQSFTPVLLLIERVSAAGAGLVTIWWVARAPRQAPAWYGWVAMALAFSAADIWLNSVAGRRYDEQWWASLAMRVATFAVLAVSGLVTVLVQLGRQERYSEAELDRREAELSESLQATAQLLRTARALSEAVGRVDVAQAVVRAAIELTQAPRAVVEMFDPATGTLSLLASAGTDAETDRRLVGISPGHSMPGSQVLRTGEPVYTERHSQTHARFTDLSGFPALNATAAVAALPLLLATGHVGMLVLTDDRERAWSEQERRLLAGLAAQAAQALRRAELFERQRETAETLQRGMLPRRLQAGSGVEVAARYLPGARGMTVGGDWYDSIPLPDGRTVLVVGDVMGKGAEAAAVMGRARSVVRALAAVDPEPVAVLDTMDRVSLDLSVDGFITLLYVLVDPVARTATIARAGHLPLLVAAPGRPAELVYDGGSEIVGAPCPERTSAVRPLPAGTVLGLFTDGLVENRATGLDPGLQRLTDACAAVDSDLEVLVEQLLALGEEALSYDDVCILLARV